MSSSTSRKYTGPEFLRQRVVCSVLSSCPVAVAKIRESSEAPGLRDYEAGFLQLVNKLSNGCRTDINETGSSFRLKPGWISGGEITHDCGTERSIGYFVEGILPLCLFAKKPVIAVFTGVTNHPTDPSVEYLKAVWTPILKAFGVDVEAFVLKSKRRGFMPEGGGEVEFRCPPVRELRCINVCDEGTLRRVRGTAFTAKVSPHVANRLVQSARAILDDSLPDVHIFTDHSKGKDSGLSPGFGIMLAAETSTGCVLAVEKSGAKGELPEETGKSAAKRMIKQITRRGCVDADVQAWIPLLMVLTPEDVSKIRFGRKLTEECTEMLRHIRDFFGCMFQIKEDSETETVILTCLGIGYKNYAKKVT